jgi:CBS domain-containing protein
MLVQDVMQTKLHTVTPETTLPEAIRLTGQRGVRHLPVLDPVQCSPSRRRLA